LNHSRGANERTLVACRRLIVACLRLSSGVNHSRER
jgi:hypothetical protein